ncbi:MAG TPA: hypothetical protein VMT30_06225 [Candidatus Saccharimonadia bacterium]|nr:hypothetical protein [Candidatus Saccharimonadia bacterium]
MIRRVLKPKTAPFPPPRRSHLHRACADDIRAAGWCVAVHNDYRLADVPMTFWLFTHAETGRFVQGEGCTDAQALDEIRKQLSTMDNPTW